MKYDLLTRYTNSLPPITKLVSSANYWGNSTYALFMSMILYLLLPENIINIIQVSTVLFVFPRKK